MIFMESDTDMLDKPHNDHLVIELLIDDCEVTHILVYTRSSVDLIVKETVKKWKSRTLKSNQLSNRSLGLPGKQQ